MTMFSDGMLLGAGSASGPLTFIAAASASVAATNVTVNIPTGTQAGDFLIAIVWCDDNLTAAATTGWTTATTSFTDRLRYVVYTRTATGSEGSTVTFTQTGAGVCNAALLCYRGGTGAIDVIGAKTAVNQPASSTTSTAASLTATRAGFMLGLLAISSSGRTVTTAPTSMTQRTLQTSVFSAAVYELDPSAVGATAGKTLQWNASSNTAGVQIQIY